MRVYLETMGCQMNKLDSELVVGRLRAVGHEIVETDRTAEVVLYNTCSVRSHAEQKVLSRLGVQGKRKRSGKDLIVGVLGCMAQRMGQGLLTRYGQVDIVCGPSEIDSLVDMIDHVVATRRRQLAVAPPRASRTRTDDEEANRRLEAFDLSRSTDADGSAQAFVRVQRGCDNFCSYCIVPYVRGSEQSRDPARIVEEVRRLAGAGCKEVTLLGQTVSNYRHGDDGASVGLAGLMERIHPIDGVERIRFVTSYPATFDRAILRAMAELPKVCEYLHIPAQSGSDRMLRAMNRKYTVAEYRALIDEAKATVPGLAVAGDFIVGFCGESDEEFQASCDLIRAVGYKNSFIFKYSTREGTAAARSLTDDVPEAVKKRRNNELLAVQNEVSEAHNRGMIGSTQQVLVTGRSVRADRQPNAAMAGMTQLQGRTRGDHIIVFDGTQSQIGQFVDVSVTDATALVLTAVRL